MNFSFIIIFSIFIFATSILYFYLFSRKQERFMQFWGFAWVAYSLSLLCLLCFMNTDNQFYMEMRKVIDMFNMLLLLFGSYSFVHIRIPTYWYRFSLYLLLLALICIYYDFDLLSFYLPISTYQLIVTIFICYNIYKLWHIARGEKIIATIIFFIWGFSKAAFSIAEVFADIDSLYITEILLSNLLNFCILMIYVMYTQKENNLSGDLYHNIIENSKDVIFHYRLTPYKAFDYISPSVKDVTGFSQSFFYDNPGMFTDIADEKNKEEVEDIFSDKIPANDLSVVEMINKDGEKFWGEFNCTIIYDNEKRPSAIDGTFRDITNVKSAELKLINATKNRNMLFSYISHELRTPITSIAGYLTALNDGIMSSDEEKSEAMDIITTKTLTLKKLVDDLDQLSKLETHQFNFNFMSCTAGDITEILLSNNSADIKSAGFELTAEYDLPNLYKHWLVADYDRINQVFSNLITNAMKYSHHEKKIFLNFRIDDREENYVVSVEDRGMGIKENNLPYVFDRFYRENDGSNTYVEGRGLGLTLCREIIAAHHGDIYVESTYGFGSTFTFIIPLYKED